MQTPTFARVKIQPPRPRPGLIARSRLDEPLAAALASCRLVLLSAPAGFGKTAALTQQIATLPPSTALAWVAADADDDLNRLAACLVAALDPFDLPWRSSPEAMVAMQDGSRAARQALASELLNALDATEVARGLIVIDDAHRIEDPAVFDWLGLLIARLPPHWGMVISSRVDPPLPLAKWRAAGELAEFRQEDLRFDQGEVEHLVASAGHQRIEADSLLQRTQGWAAGLSLALSARQRGGGATLTTRHMFDYMASEVLDDMPEALRLFLLRCSVLPELTPERCAAVSGDAQAALLLEEVERRGLFVTVLAEEGESGRTLSLHDLFRDCLDDRLRRERPGELVELLKRAARSDDDPARRIGYLLRAGAWEEAEQVLGEVGAELLTEGAVSTVQRFVDQFPAEFRDQAPLLQLVRGLVGWARWDWPMMCEATQRAVQGFARRGERNLELRALSYHAIALSGLGDEHASRAAYEALIQQPIDTETRCRAQLAACWHALGDGQRHRFAPLWREIVEGLEQLPSLARWYECSPLPTFVGAQGMRAPLQRYVDGVAARLPDGTTALGAVNVMISGWLQLWAGDVAAAEASAEMAEAHCRWLGRPANVQAMVSMLMATVHAVRGRREAASACMAGLIVQMSAGQAEHKRPQQLAFVLFHAIRVAVVAEDSDTQQRLAVVLRASYPRTEWAVDVDQRMTLPAHLAMAGGQLEQACTHWRRALDHEERIDVFGQGLETRLRLADALLQSGGPAGRAEAAQHLAPVFERVRSSGECGGVLMAGPQVLARLAEQDWQGALPAGDAAQLRTWAELTAALRATTPPGSQAQAQGAAQALSTRELEVLQRIAAGDSNKLIARAFDLSPHTVKRHVANIFDKLGLSSRGQAAAWLHSRQQQDPTT
ncbi:MAG: transcriptional regulator [Burkholderiaceae bacterium]|nr:transcriptional regulator [Burkholderiaceae bacterium]